MIKIWSTQRHLLVPPTVAVCFLLIVCATLSFTNTRTVSSKQNAPQSLNPTSTPNASSLPAQLCTEADELGTKQKRESNQAAVEKYLQAARLWREAGDASKAATALTRAGELQVNLGDLQAASNSFHESLVLAKSSKAVVEKVRALNGLAYVSFLEGDSSDAREKSTQALKLAKEIKNRELEARALSNLAEGVYGYGDLTTAKNYQQAALEIWTSLGDQRGRALAEVALAYYNANLSEPFIALGYLDDAMKSAQETGDVHGQVLTLNAMGNVKAKLGRKQEALEAYDQAKPLAEQIGDRVSLASILAGTASLYYWMGDARSAIAYDEQALKTFEKIAASWGIAETKLDLGRAYNSLGSYEQSLSNIREALELFRKMGMRRLQARALSEIGVVQASTADYAKSLQSLRQSLKLNPRAQDYRFEAYTFNLIGTVYERLNDREQAIRNYQRALQLSRIASDQAAESNSLFNIAHIERDRGNLVAAEQNLRSALEIAESVRQTVSSQDLRILYFSSIRDIYELYIDVLMLQHKNDRQGGLDERAFAISERARARSLLELLQEGQANIREGIDPALLQKERSVREMLNARADRHMEMLRQKDFAEANRIRKEIDELSVEHERVRDQIRATSPRYAALTSPEPLTLKEVQQHLVDNDSVLLEYALGTERSYLWAITRTSFSTFELRPRVEIEESARRLYADFVAHQIVPGETVQERAERQKNAEASLSLDTAELSQLVLAPLAGYLPNKRLLIVSEGALQYIPFAALHDPDSDPSTPQYLNANHEVVREPSASTLSLLLSEAGQRTAASDSVAVFADPVFEMDDPRVKRAAYESTPETLESQLVKQALRDIGISADGVQIPRLVASSDEADAIINSAPWGTGLKAIGFDANRNRVLGDNLGRFRVVHFATHGMINNDHPELSGIVLSLFDKDGHSQDGFLRLQDIYNLHLPADLVVLSACSTGLGKDVRGEGLIGLTRGFMYAGASGVVASLWKVDDRATAELMKLFYEGMFRKQLPPAAALREAQLRMSQQKAWRSPYYWAGFIIQGRYDAELNVSPRSSIGPRSLVVISLLIAVAFIATIFVVRGRRSRTI